MNLEPKPSLSLLSQSAYWDTSWPWNTLNLQSGPVTEKGFPLFETNAYVKTLSVSPAIGTNKVLFQSCECDIVAHSIF